MVVLWGIIEIASRPSSLPGLMHGEDVAEFAKNFDNRRQLMHRPINYCRSGRIVVVDEVTSPEAGTGNLIRYQLRHLLFFGICAYVAKGRTL